MSLLPDSQRVLLGPGPSMVSPRVMRAMAAPVLSHLDPDLVKILDEVRAQLGRVFRAPQGSFAFAVSGTGTSGMETAVANLVSEGTRALVVVSGYFGDRLAQMCQRYGARVARLEVEWGRACDPEALRRALRNEPADVVAMVHAETSTGVLNPVDAMAAIAREHDALTIVDAVTSLGGHPLEIERWGIDACYSCSQKCVGAPSGMSPIVFSPSALARRTSARSFYLDLALLEDYWVRRKYHHTLCSSLLYALFEAVVMVEEEGLEARWDRHRRHHLAFAAGIDAMGLELLPPVAERLWTLNAIAVPEGINEANVRKHLLDRFNIEVGAGLGPLAGRIWRVGLMGASSSRELIVLFLGALEQALRAHGYASPSGAGAASASESFNVRM